MPPRPVSAPPATGPLNIGLVNNMPDAALAQTERQWTRLLRAAGGEGVAVHLFALSDLPRAEATRARMAGAYRNVRDLASAGLDAVVVTGAEPLAADLADEPYRCELGVVIDWAAHAAGGAVFSCLAAHAAVLHLDGVERRALPTKLSGVFPVSSVGGGREPRPAGVTPHSRTNGLDEADLARAGYTVLKRGEAVGVDAFAKSGGAPMLFLQGHAEYEADTLAREYLRDVGRFLRGERAIHPAAPESYFDADALAAFDALARAVERPRLSAYTAVVERAALAEPWRAPAVRLFADWLGAVAKAKDARRVRPVRTATRATAAA